MYKFRFSLIALGVLLSAQAQAVNIQANGETVILAEPNPINIREISSRGSTATPVFHNPTTLSFLLPAQTTLINNNVGDVSFTGRGIIGPERLNVINNGTLIFESGSTSGPSDICNNDILDFRLDSNANQTKVINGTAAPGGQLSIEGPTAGQRVFNLGRLCGGGVVEPFNGAVFFSVGGTGTVDTNDVFSGAFLNGGGGEVLSLSKVGPGTFTVTGMDHEYSGPTTIQNGCLVWDGAFIGPGSNFTVEGSNSILKGTGTITGNLLNLGKVYPGNNANHFGVLTVDGDYTGPATATGVSGPEICFHVRPVQGNPGANPSTSRLNVTGTANVANTTARFNFDAGRYNIFTQTPILDAAGGLMGSFKTPAADDPDNQPFLTATVNQTNIQATVFVTENSYAEVFKSCFSDDGENFKNRLNVAQNLQDSRERLDGNISIKPVGATRDEVNVLFSNLNVVRKNDIETTLDSTTPIVLITTVEQQNAGMGGPAYLPIAYQTQTTGTVRTPVTPTIPTPIPTTTTTTPPTTPTTTATTTPPTAPPPPPPTPTIPGGSIFGGGGPVGAGGLAGVAAGTVTGAIASPFVPILRANAAGYRFAEKSFGLRKAYFKQNKGCGAPNFYQAALTLKHALGSHQRDHGRAIIADNPGHGHLWFQGFGSKADAATTENSLGYRSNTAGVMMGFDYQVQDDLRLGVGGGYSHSNLNTNGNLGHSNIETPFGSLWGLYTLGDYEIDFALGYQRNSHKVKRYVRVANFRPTVRRKSTGYNLLPHLGVAYNIWSGCDVHVKPLVALDFLYIHENGFRETGGGVANLVVKDFTASTLQSSVGLLVDRNIQWLSGVIRPSFEVRYMNRKQIRIPKIVSAFQVFPQATFVTSSHKETLHRMGLATEVAYVWNNGGTFKLRYQGDYGKNQKSHTGLISIGKSW